jgi:trans-aconitate methyltransferase
MTKKIHDSIIKHYSTLYKKYGSSPKSLGWLNGRQSVRFDVISQIGIKNKDSVLDIGCGFGDFFGYLQYKKIKVDYHGIDINEKFLDLAREKYPKALFEVRDIQTNKIKKKYDWVVATGITNYATNYNYLKKILEEMFKISKKGVVMDFITDYVDYKDKDIFYSSPEKMFQYAKNLTKRVTLRHDYIPFEFCLYLFKNDSKNKKNVFSNYYNQLSTSQQKDLWLKNKK